MQLQHLHSKFDVYQGRSQSINHLQVAGICVQGVYIIADVRIAEQEGDLQVRLLASKSSTHSRSEGSATKHHHFICSVQGRRPTLSIALKHLGPSHEVLPIGRGSTTPVNSAHSHTSEYV